MIDERRQDDARAFFGRRRSHKLRSEREATFAALMPSLRIALPAPETRGRTETTPFGATAHQIEYIKKELAPQSLFSSPQKEIRIEIGFGGGEHLIAEALDNPETGFIGCEAYVDGVARVVGAIERHGLTNIRLFDGDAIALIDRLPAGSIARIDLLYPDPWPKRRQRKRRFVSRERLAALARLLAPGGEFRFATDIDDYAAWVLTRVLDSQDWDWPASHADDWRRPWPNWTSTRYEAKALREGRKPVYLTFRRK